MAAGDNRENRTGKPGPERANIAGLPGAFPDRAGPMVQEWDFVAQCRSGGVSIDLDQRMPARLMIG